MGARKRHSPVAFAIIGALVGLLITGVIGFVMGMSIKDNDPLLTAEQLGEKVGEAVAPLALVLMVALGVLGARWAIRKNRSRH